METIVNCTALISHLAIGKQHSISKYHRNWQWQTFKSNNEQPILCSKYLVVIKKKFRIFSTFVCIIRCFTCEKEFQKQIDKQKMWYPSSNNSDSDSNNKNRTFIQYHFAEKMGSSNRKTATDSNLIVNRFCFKNVWKIAQTANVHKWVFSSIMFHVVFNLFAVYWIANFLFFDSLHLSLPPSMFGQQCWWL